MVVLRSTTDCAAVSSRRSSARETVISRLPVGAATSGVMVAVDTVWSLPWAPSSVDAEGFPGVAVAFDFRASEGFRASAWGCEFPGTSCGDTRTARGFVCWEGSKEFGYRKNASKKESESRDISSSRSRCGWKSG